MTRFVSWFLTAALLPLAASGAERPALTVQVRNFGVVNQNLLRGAEPTPRGLAALSAAGVKLVIDLRSSGEGTGHEKQEAEKLGLRYLNIPFPPLSAPSPQQIRTVLGLLVQNQSQTVFLHCRRGKDRTGTVIACYRIQHDGWDTGRALEEARKFGMSSAERGMKSFISHFTRVSNASEPPLLLAH